MFMKSLKLQYESEIAKAKDNIEVYMSNPAGIGEHPDLAAAILKPFVSEANHWMVQHHGIFQGYYFWHYLGGDRNARDEFAGHEFYDYCEEFCALYDAPAFDPSYESNPLEHYIPLLEDFFTSNP